MFLSLSKPARWRKKFDAAYPFLNQSPAEPTRLRLILGVGRSGTSWVCQMLFKTKQPARCFSEPLFHIQPALPFHQKGDHTALGYEPIPVGHPLAAAYQLLTHPKLGGVAIKGLERNDPDWKFCLVKEVHSLLGTEGLLQLWQSPTLLILRDPIYILDSLFAAQTLETIYLDHELAAVYGDAFLDRFMTGRQNLVRESLAEARERSPRERIILQKFLCIQLMQEMLSQLAVAYPCATAVRYEDLCVAPQETFPAVAKALGLTWDDTMADYLAKTTKADATSSDPYSVVRNTGEQKDRPFKFLSPAEIVLCQEAAEAIKGDTSNSTR